jgi:cell shape-determining protein MreC
MCKTNNTSNSSIRINYNNNNNISPFKIKPNHNISSYNSKYNYNKTVQTYLNEISKLKSEVSKLQKENALLKEELLSEQTQHSHYRQLTEDMINYYNTTKLKKQKHFYSK